MSFVRKSILVFLAVLTVFLCLIWLASYFPRFISPRLLSVKLGQSNSVVICANGAIIFSHSYCTTCTLRNWEHENNCLMQFGQPISRMLYDKAIGPVHLSKEGSGSSLIYQVETKMWCLEILVGLYPILAAMRFPRRLARFRRRRGLCVKCGYNLTGNTTGTCPECGTKFKTRDVESPQRGEGV